MGKLIMWNLITLDGYFEGPKKWDLDFHNTVWGDELEQFSIQQLSECHALVFGRITYEGMAAYWRTAPGEAEVARFMNTLPKVVFSRTLQNADWNNTKLVKENIAEEIVMLKQSKKDSYVFGSADLSATLMTLGLIDEYRICVVPVILGRGTPLFKPISEPLPLHLLDTRALNDGGIILRYGRNTHN